MLRATLTAAATVAMMLVVTPAAGAASRAWTACDKSATKAAADTAGVPAALDADVRLRTIFDDDAPSRVLQTIVRSLCADYDGDGDRDRLVMYGCCSVTTPSPFAILRNDGSTHAIAYARLHDTVFSLRRAGRGGRDLVEREPKYGANDANCCPSQIRERRIHWSGKRFVITLRPAGPRA